MNNISIETGNIFNEGFRRTVYRQEIANNEKCMWMNAEKPETSGNQ